MEHVHLSRKIGLVLVSHLLKRIAECASFALNQFQFVVDDDHGEIFQAICCQIEHVHAAIDQIGRRVYIVADPAVYGFLHLVPQLANDPDGDYDLDSGRRVRPQIEVLEV